MRNVQKLISREELTDDEDDGGQNYRDSPAYNE